MVCCKYSIYGCLVSRLMDVNLFSSFLAYRRKWENDESLSSCNISHEFSLARIWLYLIVRALWETGMWGFANSVRNLWDSKCILIFEQIEGGDRKYKNPFDPTGRGWALDCQWETKLVLYFLEDHHRKYMWRQCRTQQR